MTQEHFSALLVESGAKTDGEGWSRFQEGALVTLYAAANGASLSISRIEALRSTGDLLYAKTVKGEQFIVPRDNVFAAAVEGTLKKSRKAGFASA